MNKHRSRDKFDFPDRDSPEVTADDLLWAIMSEDFPDFDAGDAFLEEREQFLFAAENAGLARDTFLHLSPNKPGFIQRATAMLESVVAVGKRIAAE